MRVGTSLYTRMRGVASAAQGHVKAKSFHQISWQGGRAIHLAGLGGKTLKQSLHGCVGRLSLTSRKYAVMRLLIPLQIVSATFRGPTLNI